MKEELPNVMILQGEHRNLAIGTITNYYEEETAYKMTFRVDRGKLYQGTDNKTSYLIPYELKEGFCVYLS